MDDSFETEFEESIAKTYTRLTADYVETSTVHILNHQKTNDQTHSQFESIIVNKQKNISIPLDLLRYKIAPCLTPYERCLHSRLSKTYHKAFEMENRDFRFYVDYFNQLIFNTCSIGKDFLQINSKDLKFLLTDDYKVETSIAAKYKIPSKYFDVLFFLIHYQIFNLIGNSRNNFNSTDDDNDIFTNVINQRISNDVSKKYKIDNQFLAKQNCLLRKDLININGLKFCKYNNKDLNNQEHFFFISHFIKNLLIFSYNYNIIPITTHYWQSIDMKDCDMNDEDLLIFLRSIELNSKNGNYSYSHSYGDSNINDSKSCWMNLRKIDISNNKNITNKSMKYLFEKIMGHYLINLESIRIADCGITIETLIYINNCLNQVLSMLKKFQMEKLKQFQGTEKDIDVEYLKWRLDSCRKLKMIVLASDKNMVPLRIRYDKRTMHANEQLIEKTKESIKELAYQQFSIEMEHVSLRSQMTGWNLKNWFCVQVDRNWHTTSTDAYKAAEMYDLI